MDLQRGFQSYKTAKLNNIKPNAMTYANLLSLTAGFGDQGELLNVKRFHLLNMFYITVYTYRITLRITLRIMRVGRGRVSLVTTTAAE
jgi:hypothetical protein